MSLLKLSWTALIYDFTHICFLISVRAKGKKETSGGHEERTCQRGSDQGLMRCGSNKKTTTKNKKEIVTTKGDNRRQKIKKKHRKTINDIYSINSTPHQKEPEVSPEAASTNRREGKTKVQLQCVQWRCKSASILLCGVLLATLQCHGELYVHSYLQRCKSASILLLGIDIV